MRIIVVGATGTIGTAVADALAGSHDVVRVGRRTGELRVDLASKASIRQLYEDAAPFDAVVSAAGAASFGPLAELDDDAFALGLKSKLMGQVNLIRVGLGRVADGGSFTLTAGILSRQPMPGGTAISLVNAALEGFVRSAALEMPRGVRVNVVSPGWVAETLAAMGRDPSAGTPAAKVARAYVKAVEGRANGEVLDA